MALVFRTLRRASSAEVLNEEWMLLENTGANPINTKGCAVTVARSGQRPRALGTLDPGFILQPGEQVRIVTGSPAKKAHGKAPEDKAARNYHLFLMDPILTQEALVVRIALNQMVLAAATFASDAPDGITKS